MAKDKERSVNPAQAQRKADKAKALKKSRQEQQARRHEKLARQNPDRLQRQIDDLKALEASGEIKAREKEILAGLERDLKGIKKAREILGDKVPLTDRRPPREDRRDRNSDGSVLGKRRHDGERKRYDNVVSSGSDTDDSVRNIPMPRDTPPPMPRDHRRHQPQRQDRRPQHGHDEPAPERPARVTIESKTTYSSAPQIRDLAKEATSRFVPGAVRRKQDAVKGRGGLLEPEELDRLEQEGYLRRDQPKDGEQSTPTARVNETDAVPDEATQKLRDEEARFAQELAAEMELDKNNATDSSRNMDGSLAIVSSSKHPQGVTINDNHTSKNMIYDLRQNDKDFSNEADKAEEQDEDEDEEDYLPPLLMQGRKNTNTTTTTTTTTAAAAAPSSLFSTLPKPKSEPGQPPKFPSQSSAGQDADADADLDSSPNPSKKKTGLFSTLPAPAPHLWRHQVEIEDVQDEDL